MFALANSNQCDSDCMMIDALRFKRYFGFMLKQCEHLEFEELRPRYDAVLDHLFDEHLKCDVQWCKPLQIKENKINNLPDNDIDSCFPSDSEDRPPSPSSPEPEETPQWYYRSKLDHPLLYKQMSEAYDPY